jgi:hypothetical protein
LKNPFQALVPIANTHLNKFDNTPWIKATFECVSYGSIIEYCCRVWPDVILKDKTLYSIT